MRELTFQEKQEVGGAFVAWAVSSVALVAASYSMARYFNSSSSSNGGRVVDTGSMCVWMS